jgi:ribosomal protein S18 acetylase RimI-like enzyme
MPDPTDRDRRKDPAALSREVAIVRADPDTDALRPPRGAFLLALASDTPPGCAALKGDGGDNGEIKRLWIAPEARGMGLVKRLMAAAAASARSLGMTRLRLDTNRALTETIALCRATGWTEIQRFNEEPYADHWFEKRLQVGKG